MFLSSSGDAILPRLIVRFDSHLTLVAVSSVAAARLAALGDLPSAAYDLPAPFSMKTVAKQSAGPVSLIIAMY